MFKFIKNHIGFIGLLSALVVTLAVVAPNIQFEQSKTTGKYIVTIGYSTVSATGATDYAFTGTADNIPFNTAISALLSASPAGGEIMVTSPATGFTTINFTASVTVPANVEIVGSGTGTSFVDNGTTPIFTVGGSNVNFQNLKTDAGGISGSYTASNITIGSTYFATVGTGISAPTGRTASYVICPSNGTALDKSQADLILTGTNDAVAINSHVAANMTMKILSGTVTIGSTDLILNAANFVLEGEGTGTIITPIANQGASYSGFIQISANNVRITNMQIQGNGTNQVSALFGIGMVSNNTIMIDHVLFYNHNGAPIITGNDVSGLQILNNTFNSCFNYGGTLFNGASGHETQNVVIANNIANTDMARGFIISNIIDCIVSNNVVSGTHAGGNDAISVTNGFIGSGLVRNLSITGNMIDGSGAGITLEIGSITNVSITGNVINNVTTSDAIGVYSANANNVTISGNTITNSPTQRGIYCYMNGETTGATFTIVSNAISNCLWGMVLYGSDSATHNVYGTVSSNTVKGCQNAGISLGNASNTGITKLVVDNNIVYDNNQVANGAWSGPGCAGIAIRGISASLNNNTVFDDQTVKTQAIGIYILNFESHCNVLANDNVCYGNINSQFDISGTTGKVTAVNNTGFNPVGKITNPIGTGTIGLVGSGTTVTSATVYTVCGVDCFITSTGGTVSNIVIKDAGGNTMLTGVTTLTNQFIPIGYSVTWTHTGAPTVTVFGN